MAVKKIGIHFSDKKQKEIKELAELMGIANIYGEIPKAVAFGITFTLSALKNPAKVYHDLDEAELGFYLQSIKSLELKGRLLKKAEELQKQATKV